MATFLQNGRNQRILESGNSIEDFDLSVSEFIEKFTNYGCYCWILDPERGVIGGGQTRDQIDGLCGQLYKCYKCLNLDYGHDQSKLVYDVSCMDSLIRPFASMKNSELSMVVAISILSTTAKVS